MHKLWEMQQVIEKQACDLRRYQDMNHKLSGQLAGMRIRLTAQTQQLEAMKSQMEQWSKDFLFLRNTVGWCDTCVDQTTKQPGDS
jgi:hypothetical protein